MLRRSKAPGDPGFEAECRDYQETIRNFVFAHCDIELRDAIGWHSRFSLYAGLRVGEIAALKIRDVATSEGEIRREIKLDRFRRSRCRCSSSRFTSSLEFALHRIRDAELLQLDCTRVASGCERSRSCLLLGAKRTSHDGSAHGFMSTRPSRERELSSQAMLIAVHTA
jgi:integrase